MIQELLRRIVEWFRPLPPPKVGLRFDSGHRLVFDDGRPLTFGGKRG